MGIDNCNADYTMFITRANEKINILIVYVGDMMMTGDDLDEASSLKALLDREIEINDFGPLSYFLETDVVTSNSGISILQRKYVLDLYQGTGLLSCRRADTPIEVNHRLGVDAGDLVDKDIIKGLLGS